MKKNEFRPRCAICGRDVKEVRLIPTVVRHGSGWKPELICIECLYRLMKAHEVESS